MEMKTFDLKLFDLELNKTKFSFTLDELRYLEFLPS